MMFHPVIPVAVLLAVAAVLSMVRMVALYRVLVRTGSGRYRPVVVRWSLLTVAIILLLVAAARPAVDTDDAQMPVEANPNAVADPNLNVFFVVDRSVNSRVEDYGDRHSRMTGIRSDISGLIDEYPHARFGVISYASRAALDWPLSDDAWSLRSMVGGLSPYTLVTADAMYQTDATAAAKLLADQLNWAAATFPGSHSVVFYLGTGAAGSHSVAGSFGADTKKIVGGAVLGYGTPQGGPIPQGWANGAKVYQSDPSNPSAALTSTIDEARLKQIAVQLGVPYFHREAGTSISSVVPAVDLGASTAHAGVVPKTHPIAWRELYWLFTALACGLLAGEVVMTIREFRRNRMARRDVTP
ncbi:VWA domain-containing protein [Mycolicibacter sp. MYC123]|uniref:VWA domain-containing protein n=1 Tax=[Mycobacterium] zoologicum TaxID=2872311 RepID=A0ABU5YI59_9MYCO|nr:VWA domain-containing protein [Mycolicibacter sp. MYC123]MEB3049732.1 VWA domain-containing protein [Mycolicibacter sp. MYC123]